MPTMRRLSICLLGLFLATLPAAAADAPKPSIFPVFSAGSGEYLGVSLVNTAGAANSITVTWTDSEGDRTLSRTLVLAPGAQSVLLSRELLGTTVDPEDGWIRIQPSDPGLLCYLAAGAEGMLDGVEAASGPAASLLFDLVDVFTGFAELEHTDSLVTLVNPGGTAEEAQLELFGFDGKSAGTATAAIPALGSRTLRVSGVFGDALPGNGLGGKAFAGYLKVVSGTGLAGWLRIETPLSRRLLRGRSIPEIESTSLAVAPHFAAGGGELYRSVLTLVNAGVAAARLELNAQDDGGRPIGSPVTLTLEPGQGIREDVMSLFRVFVPAVFPPPLLSGYVRIRAGDAGSFRIAGVVELGTEGMAAAMFCPVLTKSATDWTIPYAVSSAGYFTGYAVANANELLTVQADVTVELLDSAGVQAAPSRVVSLSPSARLLGLIYRDIRSGYLRIRANGPVFPVGSIGTAGGSLLAHLPAFAR
jgi:hypothetical protein